MVKIYILKAAVLILGAIILTLCIFALPSIWKGGSVEFPTASTALLLIMIGLYATAVPFFIGLYQAWKFLGYVGKQEAFSEQSVRALRNIKYCAAVIGVLYMGGVPLLLPIAEADDAPGLLVFGFGIACIPIIVAVFAALLEQVFCSAAELKVRN